MSRTMDRTVAWCNKVRIAAGKKPLKKLKKGIPDMETECTIARTLNFDSHVSADDAYWDKPFVFTQDTILANALEVAGAKKIEDAKYRVPKYVGEIARRFDAGAYPELEEKS